MGNIMKLSVLNSQILSAFGEWLFTLCTCILTLLYRGRCLVGISKTEVLACPRNTLYFQNFLKLRVELAHKTTVYCSLFFFFPDALILQVSFFPPNKFFKLNFVIYYWIFSVKLVSCGTSPPNKVMINLNSLWLDLQMCT